MYQHFDCTAIIFFTKTLIFLLAEGLLKEDLLMVSFHPDLKKVAMATTGEYIFIMDRSGTPCLSCGLHRAAPYNVRLSEIE